MRARHQVLGVSKSATQAEVKSAYRRLARASHPDQSPGDRLAAGRWQELQTAYDDYRKSWAEEAKAGARAAAPSRPASDSPETAQSFTAAKDLSRPFAAGMIGIFADLLKSKIGRIPGGVVVEIAGKAGQAAVDAAADRARTKVDEILKKP